jgi:hypothetical protein
MTNDEADHSFAAVPVTNESEARSPVFGVELRSTKLRMSEWRTESLAS